MPIPNLFFTRRQTCSSQVRFAVRAMRQGLQAELHPLHPPADPFGHAAVPVPVLREEVPPKVRHEEAHLHPYRFVPGIKKVRT